MTENDKEKGTQGQCEADESCGAWHTLVVHEASTILEAKDGRYEK